MVRGTHARASGAFALQIDACGLASVIRAANEESRSGARRAGASYRGEPGRRVGDAGGVRPIRNSPTRLLELMSRLLGRNRSGSAGAAAGGRRPDRGDRPMGQVTGGRVGQGDRRSTRPDRPEADGSLTVLGPGGETGGWAAWRPGAAEAIIESPQSAAETLPEVAPVRSHRVRDRLRSGRSIGRPRSDAGRAAEHQGSVGGHLPAVAGDLAITSGGCLLPVAPPGGGALGRRCRRRRRARGGRPDIDSGDRSGVPARRRYSVGVSSATCGWRGRREVVLPVPAGPAVPPDAWFVVEAACAGLPKIGGRPVAPAGLARQIAACPGRRQASAAGDGRSRRSDPVCQQRCTVRSPTSSVPR